MSQFTDELRAFVDRLAADGYPVAVVERAAERMEALEEQVVLQYERINKLQHKLDTKDE